LPIEDFVKYLKTYSAYNIYMQNKDKEDPVALFENEVRKTLLDYTKKKNISLKEKPILMKVSYFLVILKKMLPILPK